MFVQGFVGINASRSGGFPTTTRKAVLTSQLDIFLQALVASGRYQNVSEALRAEYRLLELEEEQTRRAICARLARGMEQAQRGQRAAGTGADAIRRAFAQARRRSSG